MLITLAPMFAACTMALATVARVPAFFSSELGSRRRRVDRLEGPRGLPDRDDRRVRRDAHDPVGRTRRRRRHLGFVRSADPAGRWMRRGAPSVGRRRRWWWRRRTVWVIVTGDGGGGGAGGGGASTGRRWCAVTAGGGPAGGGNAGAAASARASASPLRRSADHRATIGAVRVAIGQPVAAHDVVAAGHDRQPRAGIDAGVDDRDRHTVAGGVLPGLADVEHGEARRHQRDVGVPHGDRARSNCWRAHRLIGSRWPVRRHPARIHHWRWNRLCRRNIARTAPPG